MRQARRSGIGGAANEAGSAHRGGVCAYLACFGLLGRPEPGLQRSLVEGWPVALHLETDDAVDDLRCQLSSGQVAYGQAKLRGDKRALAETVAQWRSALEDGIHREDRLLMYGGSLTDDLRRLGTALDRARGEGSPTSGRGGRELKTLADQLDGLGRRAGRRASGLRRRAGARRAGPRHRPAGDPALLLVQLGSHAAGRFAERLAPLGLEPRHVGVLRSLAVLEGRSQQHTGEVLRIAPSRMVAIVDELDRRGLLERRRHESDRRAYALYLTTEGWRLLDQLRQIAADYNAELFAGLTARPSATS